MSHSDEWKMFEDILKSFEDRLKVNDSVGMTRLVQMLAFTSATVCVAAQCIVPGIGDEMLDEMHKELDRSYEHACQKAREEGIGRLESN